MAHTNISFTYKYIIFSNHKLAERHLKSLVNMFNLSLSFVGEVLPRQLWPYSLKLLLVIS